MNTRQEQAPVSRCPWQAHPSPHRLASTTLLSAPSILTLKGKASIAISYYLLKSQTMAYSLI